MSTISYQESVEVVKIIPQERISERVCEQVLRSSKSPRTHARKVSRLSKLSLRSEFLNGCVSRC